MEKELYDAKDIQKITGLGITSCYEIINKLQESFIQDYPNCLVLKKKIPRTYFDKKILAKEAKVNE